MIVYRLTHGKYKDDISGKGAQIAGGRWNSVGNRMLYTCENRALCVTEIAVHTPLGIVPQNYFLQSIALPDIEHKTIEVDQLGPNWRNFPHHFSTKIIGDQFLDAEDYLYMKVPSAIIMEEYNYVVNPLHPDFSKVKITETRRIEFDRRLFE